LAYPLSEATWKLPQLRRRGLGNALLQRALAELRFRAKAEKNFLGP